MGDERSEARARIERSRAERGETKKSPQQEPEAGEKTGARSQGGDEMSEAKARIEQARAKRGESEQAPQQEESGTQEVNEQASASARSAYSGLLETVKNKPVPVAIAGGVLILVALRRLIGGSKKAGGSRLIR